MDIQINTGLGNCSYPPCNSYQTLKVKCTICQLEYCSAKCKKAHYKIHKKNCTFQTSIKSELAKMPMQDLLDIQNMQNPEDKVMLPTDNGLKIIEIKSEIHKFMFPDGKVEYLTHDDGNIEIFLTEQKTTELFVKLYSSNLDKITIPDDKTYGFLQAIYNNYIEFGTACYYNDYSKINWINDSDCVENTENTKLIDSLNKHGRVDNKLLARIAISADSYIIIL